MDGLTVTKICNILKKNLINIKINNISVLEYNVYIDLNKAPFKQLIFVLINDFVAIYPSKEGEENDKFIKFLNNAVIVDISTRTFDRILFIDLIKYRASGKKTTYRLVFELISKMPNFFILDEEGKIIYMLRQHFLERERPIKLGAVYVPFKENSFKTLINDISSPFEEMLGFYNRTVFHAKVLLESGLSKEEVCTNILKSLDDDVFYVDKKNYLIPFVIKEFKLTINFIDLINYYNNTLFIAVYEQKKKRVLSFLKKQLEAKNKLLDELNKDYHQALDASSYEEQAKMLKYNYPFLKDKKGEVTVKKYLENGIIEEKIYVEGDGSLKKKIDALFKKSKKLKKSKSFLEKRIKSISDDVKELQNLIIQVENSHDKEEIEFFFNTYFKSNKKHHKLYKVEFYNYFYKDVKYFVGRSNNSNDKLTFHVAAPNDMWFHAKDIPGAHVIAKKNSVLDKDEIDFGARLAASFSKWRKENKVPIVYTLKKYVSKPKKAPQGFVIYRNFKTLVVSPFTEEELSAFKANNNKIISH